MGLSLAVITYNEEENIIRLLDSIADIVDEIIIVDSYSTDRTKEITIQNYPQVKFFEKKFNGYGEQKNYALDLCTQDWILFLDADEIPNEILKRSIQKVVAAENSEFNIYQARFNNHIGNHQIKYGGWGNVYRERLFKKKSAKYSDDKVHEFLVYNEKAGFLEGKIDHYTYKNIHHHVMKINKYSDLMAKKMFEKGKKAKFLKIFGSPIFEFCKVFFIKGGFLDGIYGFYIASTMSYYTLLKYIKLFEKNKNYK